jgi:hypothetical protein
MCDEASTTFGRAFGGPRTTRSKEHAMQRAHLRRAAGLATVTVVSSLLVTSLGTAPAHAVGQDSIVYLKGGQVWVAHADGTGAHQFTKAAYGWKSPSMDDNGNVVVVGGLARVNPGGTDSDGSSEIYRFGPDGNQLGGATPTWGSYSSPACPTYGPESARVSPDGQKVAYGIFVCGDPTYTTLWTPIGSTNLNFPGQTVGEENYYQPQWLDSSSFMASHVGTTFGTQARWYLHPVPAAQYAGTGWYDDLVDGTGAQGLLPRDGKGLAIFSDDAADYLDGKPRNVKLFLYSTSDLAHAEADGFDIDCTVQLSAASTSDPYDLSPSFSSDGTKLYWADDLGIEVANVSDRSNGCANVHPTLLIPGGSMPFVSPGALGTLDATPKQPGVQSTHGSGQGPKASFKASPHKARTGAKVKFNGHASDDDQARIVRYAWVFGDGKKATGAVVKHRFKKPGKYKVRLVVTDASGATDTVQHTVKVTRH